MTRAAAEQRLVEAKPALEAFLADRAGACGARIKQAVPLTDGAIQENWRLEIEFDGGSLPDRQDLVLTTSPRIVSGRETWVLVGAKPNSLIVTWNDDSWQTVRDDLPSWATSATVREGQLILIGNEKGILLTAIKPI